MNPAIPAARIHPDTPVGTWVVCCHHEVIVETLTEPAGNRSRYIEDYKPAHERPTRHHAFRVLHSWQSLPAPVLDARQARDEAWRAYIDTRQAYDDARQAYDDAWQAYIDAWRAYDDALREHLPTVLAVVRAEYPDLPVDWNTGHLIFPSKDTTP